MITLTILILLIVLIVYLDKKSNYEDTSYFQDTHKSYGEATGSKGNYGEYLIYKELRQFEADGAKFIYNCYLPTANGEDTEVDVIMLHKSGIYVFESKNYSGWIWGNEKDKFWTQTLQNEKNKFYNPIWQNRTHINAINSCVGMRLDCVSIITFSDRCTLKSITVTSPNVAVVHREKIRYLIGTFKVKTLSEKTIDYVYDKLYQYTQVSDEVKRQHMKYCNGKED